MVKYEDLIRRDGLDSKATNTLLKEAAAGYKHKIVVLDDDPTGIQTVHDVPVYTDWSVGSIRRGFEEPGNLFFILTNSRSFIGSQTRQAHREIGQRLLEVSCGLGVDFTVISRGDSTLRGHYPLETEVLKETLEAGGKMEIHGEILCPFLGEGGRITVGNIHYVKDGDLLIPAGETEFAGDKTFGYHSSDVREYIEEKTRGRYKKEDVLCVSTEQLGSMDICGIEEMLMSVTGFQKVVVNAAVPEDVKVFCIALYRAMARGKRFLFRTAAGFVKEFGAVEGRELLTGSELIGKGVGGGGLILAGSHTNKTTAQLERLKELPGIRFIEFNSDKVLEEGGLEHEIQDVVAREEEYLNRGTTVAVYTRRRLLALAGDTPATALERSVKISEAVQELAGRLKVAPAFIVAKGGITSSDVGTKALGVKRAWAMGQLQPGVPVWRTGVESRFPGIPYVIFPGNVGDETTLRDGVKVLMDAIKPK